MEDGVETTENDPLSPDDFNNFDSTGADNVDSTKKEDTTEQTAQGEEQNTTEEAGTSEETNQTEDKRDFKGYAKNLEAELKTLREHVATLENTATQPKVTEQIETALDVEGLTDEQKEGMGLLKGMLKEAVNEAVKPLNEELQAVKQEKVYTEHIEKPYAQSLAPEIRAELDSLPKNIPLAERLERARQSAIVNNLDKIRQIDREIGADQAYANKDTKTRMTKTLGATASKAGEVAPDIQSKFLSGQLSDADYQANKTELDKLEREAFAGLV